MGEPNLVVENEEKTALVIDQKDNVAVALVDLQMGDTCLVKLGDLVEKVTVLENILFGHKIAIQWIGKNENVFKYGEEIGKMVEPIDKGGWIHSHNMYCGRAMKHGG